MSIESGLSGGHGKFPQFLKCFDIYSLGIILMKIAFWEPTIPLTSEEERREMENNEDILSGFRKYDWWKATLRSVRDELAPEIGIAYRDAILFCLQGLENGTKRTLSI
jgi:hypothetical protein